MPCGSFSTKDCCKLRVLTSTLSPGHPDVHTAALMGLHAEALADAAPLLRDVISPNCCFEKYS